MAQLYTKTLVQFLGVRLQGDVGATTMYVSRRHKVVFFDKAPPKEPPSHQQRMQHAAWAAAARTWRHFPQDYRNRWNRAVKYAHIPIPGYALFVAFFTHHDPEALRTVERQSNQRLAETLERI